MESACCRIAPPGLKTSEYLQNSSPSHFTFVIAGITCPNETLKSTRENFVIKVDDVGRASCVHQFYGSGMGNPKLIESHFNPEGFV